MKLLLLGNPAAGGGRGARRLAVVERHLRAAGGRVETLLSERPGHARELLARPPGDVDRVVACGGDGFVNEVASALAGGELPMAIAPAGRGNDVARALGVPLSLPLAARAAVEGTEGRIDLGSAGGRLFATAAACGLDAEVSRRARSSAFQLPGAGSYVVELLRALFSFEPFEFALEHDGGRLEGRALAVAVANTPTYGGGFRIAPDAELDDGRFDVCIVGPLSRLRALRLFPTIFSGRHVRLPEVRLLRSSEVCLETEPCLGVEADGEALAATPVRLRCLEAELPVVLPPGRVPVVQAAPVTSC